MDHSVTPPAGRRATPVPYALLGGFLLLLAGLFTVSYGVGHLAGPVAPDLRGVSHHDEDPDPHHGGMDGMDGMGH
ncbi:hypothetical protein [Streptomyces sp. NPDC088923]|uniref:hypothetical protein n=1 Tax=Streptomyces sp. NPDC088923 TaxID=3365913 RepID=UPI0038303F32